MFIVHSSQRKYIYPGPYLWRISRYNKKKIFESVFLFKIILNKAGSKKPLRR